MVDAALRDEAAVLLGVSAAWMLTIAGALLVLWHVRLRQGKNERLLDFGTVATNMTLAALSAADFASDVSFFATLVREENRVSRALAVPSGVVLMLPIPLSYALFWTELLCTCPRRRIACCYRAAVCRRTADSSPAPDGGANGDYHDNERRPSLLTAMRRRCDLTLMDWAAMLVLPAFTLETMAFLPWHAEDTATAYRAMAAQRDLPTCDAVVTGRTSRPTGGRTIQGLTDSMAVTARLNMPSTFYYKAATLIGCVEDMLQLILSMLYVFVAGNVTAASSAVFSLANLVAVYLAPYIAMQIRVNTKVEEVKDDEARAAAGLLRHALEEAARLRFARDRANAEARRLRRLLARPASMREAANSGAMPFDAKNATMPARRWTCTAHGSAV